MVEHDDDELVVEVAENYVRRLGRDAVPFLRTRAMNAADDREPSSAKAWRDIADAAQRILGTN